MHKKLEKEVKKETSTINSDLSSDSTYGKFVVITRSRTGSNLLISLLDSNPDIRAFGEKFSHIENNSCKTVYDKLFSENPNKTIGFKIFYYHPLCKLPQKLDSLKM